MKCNQWAWAWMTLSFWLLPLNNVKKVDITTVRTLTPWSIRKRLEGWVDDSQDSHNYYLLRFFLSGVSCTCAFLPYIFNWKFSNASETASTCKNAHKINEPPQMSAILHFFCCLLTVCPMGVTTLNRLQLKTQADLSQTVLGFFPPNSKMVRTLDDHPPTFIYFY